MILHCDADTRVTLKAYEHQAGAWVGKRREENARINNLRRRNGQLAAKSCTDHINGACGELAAAKFLGIYWPMSVGTFESEPDLPPNFEVKTRTSHEYDLLVRFNENQDRIFILVTGTPPHFWVRGWLNGKAVPREDRIKNYGGRPAAWFVPVSELNTDWSEFKKI